jgi:hypothetical protein
MQAADAVIADVADQKRTIAIQQYTMRLAELSPGAGASIAAESGSASAGDG